MISIFIYNKTRQRVQNKIFAGLLHRANSILIKDRRISGRRNFYCELTLVGDAAIKSLNRAYHKKDRPTDVISLSFFDKNMKDSCAGEIFISLPYARRQAAKIGQSLTEELRFLFVHGLLHVFGYDHKKSREEARMLRLTYAILFPNGRGAGI